MRIAEIIFLMALLCATPARGEDVVADSLVGRPARISVMGPRLRRDSLDAGRERRDTAIYSSAGSTIWQDTTGLGLKSVSTDIRLPRLSEFREIHRNDALSGLEKVKRYGNFFVRVIDAFNNIDEQYVERIGYNFTAMLQGTSNFEFYTVGSSDYADRLTFAEHPDFRVGPYFGWRWLFLGYTFDVTHLGSRKSSSSRFEFSIYTSMFGVDLIRRRSGNDFYIRRVDGLGDDVKSFEGSDCSYITAELTGVNLYYNFNHRRYSCPAVFSQSTIQRRSAGSWQLGVSYTVHDVRFDYEALPTELLAQTEKKNEYASLERIRYYDFSLTGGYAFNWVPRRRWCVGVSVAPSLGYKLASTKTVVLQEEADGTAGNETSASSGRAESSGSEGSAFRRRMDEIFNKRGNLNVGGTGRIGVIYNNGRWFAGFFGVAHLFNYRRDEIRFSNTFGTANVCVGVYFQKKKK